MVRCDIPVIEDAHLGDTLMTVLAALALLPFAAGVQISLVIALANYIDGDRPAAGFTGPVPTLA